MRSTRIASLLFVLAVAFGPAYTAPAYSSIRNLISELGAQQTPNSFIIIAAFALLGGGILFDGCRRYAAPLIPFLLFGFCMGLVGFFPHKPLNPEASYNETLHGLHGMLATLAGISITIGFVWQGVLQQGGLRVVCFYLAAVCLGFPLLMLAAAPYQGLIQRLMYVQVFAWCWCCFPDAAAGKRGGIEPVVPEDEAHEED